MALPDRSRGLKGTAQRGDIWHIYWSQDGTKHGRSLKTKSKAVGDEFLPDERLSPTNGHRPTGMLVLRMRNG